MNVFIKYLLATSFALLMVVGVMDTPPQIACADHGGDASGCGNGGTEHGGSGTMTCTTCGTTGGRSDLKLCDLTISDRRFVEGSADSKAIVFSWSPTTPTDGNLNGNFVKTDVTGKNKFTADLSNLTPGVYVYQANYFIGSTQYICASTLRVVPDQTTLPKCNLDITSAQVDYTGTAHVNLSWSPKPTGYVDLERYRTAKRQLDVPNRATSFTDSFTGAVGEVVTYKLMYDAN